jgi:membrane protease YdiL (CAAX protease family)
MADQAAACPKAAAARLGVAAAALGSARVAGLTWTDLGLGRKDLAGGALTGALAAACAATAILTGAVLPATRSLFLDERASAAMGRDLAAELARITFIAVPAEELTYRSALFGLGLRYGSPTAALAWSSGLFGLSHVRPTLATMGQTALSGHLARRPWRQAAFVVGNVAVTSLAGAGFAWLRRSSGSVLAPLVAHAAINDAALLAGRLAHELAGTRRSHALEDG